jgi:hypothetical protein
VANYFIRGGFTYLIFPVSMIIPEVADRREDGDFEDWLTASVIENTNEQRLNSSEPFVRGITDLWMLEIAERTGKVWRGRFQVEFDKEDEDLPENDSTLEQLTGVLSFSLDTNSGEMRFTPRLDPGEANGNSSSER